MTKLIADNLAATKEVLENRKNSPEIPLKSLPNLNKKIWGLHPKKLTVIGGRTGNCKSALALQIAWDVAWQGISTLFLSMEMYEEDIIERLFCLSQKVDNTELLHGKYDKYKDHWERFEKEVEDKPLVITDMIGKTWQEIDKYLMNLTKKPRMLVIDHLQEAKSASLRNQKEVIEEYMKNLRTMAIREKVSVVLCSQINRASQEDGVGKEPQLHHLKNSGAIEEVADMVFLIHWDYQYTKKGDMSKFRLNVAKNRNGRTGWVEIKFKPENYWFYEEVQEEPKEESPKNHHETQEEWT